MDAKFKHKCIAQLCWDKTHTASPLQYQDKHVRQEAKEDLYPFKGGLNEHEVGAVRPADCISTTLMNEQSLPQMQVHGVPRMKGPRSIIEVAVIGCCHYNSGGIPLQPANDMPCIQTDRAKGGWCQ